MCVHVYSPSNHSHWDVLTVLLRGLDRCNVPGAPPGSASCWEYVVIVDGTIKNKWPNRTKHRPFMKTWEFFYSDSDILISSHFLPIVGLPCLGLQNASQILCKCVPNASQFMIWWSIWLYDNMMCRNDTVSYDDMIYSCIFVFPSIYPPIYETISLSLSLSISLSLYIYIVCINVSMYPSI